MLDPVNSQLDVSIKVVRWSQSEQPNREKIEAWAHEVGWAAEHWVDPAGTVIPPHAHPEDEMRWIIQGEVHLVLSGTDDVIVLRSGDRVEIRAGVVHALRVVGRSNAAYLWSRRRLPPPAGTNRDISDIMDDYKPPAETAQLGPTREGPTDM